ncbi:TetR family transcriptional regulator [Nonomuraea phyllanthi]|uniref:TetR family transcriptional regulator n=1 Tax=Nonomuraea phyllanthi TaxID=2219224 RepID=A0A5C4WWC0_9ACTN|nr:TetR/AcrR family transcriptional regulator [Nonomuraea phyllanthi]KAB8197104.1 TetR family transcriptional regulator [Nonomuraea phyllanthi]QFY06893.1 TetR family transcriptional regulator [Nonomuraea phyllanthi]
MGRPKKFDPDVAVDRAMDVFWRKGYGGTTPQDLVDALGIGKGSLYNTFGSKHALFEAALKRYRDSQATALVEMLERPGPVKERLRNVLRLLCEMDLSDPDQRGCMAVNTAAELGRADESAAELVRRMLDRSEDAFRALVEEGQRAGEIDAGRDARAIGSLLANTVVGMRLLARVADGPDRLYRVIDGVVDSL